MKIALGSDHRGREAALQIEKRLREAGHDIVVMAIPESGEITDYPDAAATVGNAVSQHNADRGVLICGTGLGMSIAANKIPGVRAAAAHDEITAELSRSHLDANVCCLSADLLGLRLIEKIVDRWLALEFEGGRHQRRIEKIAAIESGQGSA
ncbi:MAG: ribose 5-phosphate isomerase B [Phycisphaerales bacterium JB065]